MEQMSAGAGLGISAHVWSKGNDLGTLSVAPPSCRRRSRGASEKGSSSVPAPNPSGGVLQDISARATIVATPEHVTKDLVTTLSDDTKHALGEIHHGTPTLSAASSRKKPSRCPGTTFTRLRRARKRVRHHLQPRERDSRPRDAASAGGALMVRACGDLGRKIWDRSDDIKDLFIR
jgi:hypothetical protein